MKDIIISLFIILALIFIYLVRECLKRHEPLKGSLFYTIKDNMLFYIPDYYTNGTGMLETFIANLNHGMRVIKQYGINNVIYSDQIEKSSRYKYMHYFSIKCPPDKVPKDAFQIDNDWTMHQWITN